MEYKNVLTTCIYCGAGCRLYLQVLEGEIVGVLPDKEHPISRGSLCIKGWNAASFVNHTERLKTPLIRRGNRAGQGGLEEATWDEALAFVAEKLGTIRDESGSDSVGFFTSAKCTNEENYLLQKLARAVIKTNNVDHCARL
jgi:formate dehydrogenase major subunit/formate dehydrogenase alpha subunit